MSGQQNVVQPGQVQVLNLSKSSQIGLQQHQTILLDLAAKKIAATMDVPTLPNEVRRKLREIREPVRLFGENLANVRDRLRMLLARRYVEGATTEGPAAVHEKQSHERYDEEVTKYTRAHNDLVEARQEIARFSLERSRIRLERERQLRRMAKRRRQPNVDDDRPPEDTKIEHQLVAMDDMWTKSCHRLSNMALEGSQYADSRVMSCLDTETLENNNDLPLVVTGGWTGTINVWDGSSPQLQKLGEQTQCHQDRIMGICVQPILDKSAALVCTTSIDLTAKLYKVQKNEDVSIRDDSDSSGEEQLSWKLHEEAHLQGHAARLCRARFHPEGKHVVTTSFDHTWRLWDIETHAELLLQDGHCKPVYGVGFHSDGSLVSTTDFAGIVHIWDLRTGKSIRHFTGHAKRVLNAEFHPNGFQLATAGDDGTIKIWDLRKRKMQASIPAHSNLVSQILFDGTDCHGEYIVSSSFDGTIKMWSTRDWKMISCLQGHEGKVTGVGIVKTRTGPRCLLSTGFDKTLKLWR